ncbi:hypothetical protein D0Z00_002110 [Geotrichum galactomycetum]|uniref:Uncharacterized protein n=1 Tax=Geotrichum galactomycetum TaxID=27317 RepID=A0ACB6V528_9ASCO|nr:hypothetical protein D0Z00_002110 [Geotrichum candidum]
MTKSQYDKYLLEKKEKESGQSNAADKQHEDEEDDEDSEDEEDAPRRALENDENKHQDLRMRMRQDAHLSIYRQKMVKLTGSQIGLLNTKSKLPVNRDDDDSDQDDVPLGILKTQGFPRRPRTASNSNLLAPELAYPKRNKSSNDLDSLHSTPSTGPNTPAVEEGYLAMRNQSFMNLPGFNASVPMNRGLVGEISKEESARFKRKPMLNRSKDSDADMINGKNNQTEIQAQIQQMMSMQNKILTQMASNNSVAALNFTPTMSGGFPRSSNWSSFDVMNSHQRPISRFNTAPSVNSSNSSGHSVDNQMSAQASEEEEDDDDEKGWKEMEMKREQMRQMWKTHQVLVL